MLFAITKSFNLAILRDIQETMIHILYKTIEKVIFCSGKIMHICFCNYQVFMLKIELVGDQ